ncbi:MULTISPECIES: hypothetical protein [unclassified Brevundimonas]|uniref:hypothetical protein n=1 Tax=unclassified Brevundimonas TaxID=2622653 RepID=UPI002897ED1F|nr:hypothetical protein [Brevundimonas sp.]
MESRVEPVGLISMVAASLAKGTRGRRAKSNASGRFEATQVEAFDDGWTDDDAALPIQIATTVTPLRSRTIISKNQSPDIGFERSINTYKGCSHCWLYYSVTQP